MKKYIHLYKAIMLTLTVTVFTLHTAGASMTLQQYYNKGIAMTNAKKFSEAVEIYREAVNQYPSEAHLYGNMAHCLVNMDLLDEASSAYEKAVSLAPDNQSLKDRAAWTYYSYAWNLHQNKKNRDALSWNKKAIDLVNRYQFYLRYAQIARADHRNDIAVQALIDSLEPGLKGSEVIEYYNWLAFETGNLIPALKENKDKTRSALLAKEFTEKAADDRIIEHGISLYLFNGNTGGALSAAGRLKSPGAKDLYEGVVLARQGNLDSAKISFEKAVNSGPNDFTIPARISDSLYAISEERGLRTVVSNKENIMAMEYQQKAVDTYLKTKRPGQPRKLIPPLKGGFTIFAHPITGGRTWHTGWKGQHALDFNYTGVPDQMGQPIFAIADGEVDHSVDGYPDNPFGAPLKSGLESNFVSIVHEKGFRSQYVHLKRGSVAVKKGERVKAGQKIGELGNSGYSTGPHLHFHVLNSENIAVPVKFDGAFRRPKNDTSAAWQKTDDLTYIDFYYTTDPSGSEGGDVNTYYQKGDDLNKQKKYAEAAEVFRQGTEKFPRETGLLARMAAAYNSAGIHGRSRSAFEAALKLSPADKALAESAGWAYYSMAWSLYQKKDYTEAMAVNKRGIELLPKYQLYLRYSQISRTADSHDIAVESLIASMKEGGAMDDGTEYDNWFSWEASQLFAALNRKKDRSAADRLAAAAVRSLKCGKSLNTVAEYYSETGQCSEARNALKRRGPDAGPPSEKVTRSCP